jgi:hypothetical protein
MIDSHHTRKSLIIAHNVFLAKKHNAPMHSTNTKATD